MAGARGCFNCGGCAWRFRVVARALCADACTYSPPLLSSFSCRLCCGADGDRVFFFIHCYMSTARNQKCYPTHSVCFVTRVMSSSWTPGCELPKGGHTNLVNDLSFPSDQMTIDRVNGSRVSSCAPFVSYNCESRDFFEAVSCLAVSRSGLLMVVRDDGIGGMEGHVSRDCTMEQKAKSCYRCGREGHIVRLCFLIPPIRYPRYHDLMVALPAQLRITVA